MRPMPFRRRSLLAASLLLVASRTASAQEPAPVEVDSGCLAPVYPQILKMAGVSGRITLSYVVDTAGAVDTATIRVITTTHDLLVAPPRRAASACRYRPALRAGVHLRARVLRRFTFEPPPG